MKANEFVKKIGWDLAKEYANECPSYCNYLHEHGFYKISETWQLNEKHVLVSDLKRLVESHELVSSFGGIKRAKRILKKSYMSFSTMVSVVWNDKPFQCTLEQLEQAIADVESCHVD